MTESHPHFIARVRTLPGMLCLACGLLFFPASAFSATGDVISSFPSPGTSPFGLAWDGTNLWHADNDTKLIYELTTTGTVLSSFPVPGGNAHGLTWDGTNLWLADNSTDTIYELTTTGTVLSSFAAPGPNARGLTWDGTNLWLTDNNTDTIYELTTTGTVLSSFASPATNAQGLTWDGTNLWNADEATDTIYELTTTGTVLSSFASPGPRPRGLTWDGTNFWHADLTTGLIYQLEGPVPEVCPGGVVTTTIDSTTGGSLRACIIRANGNPGTDTLTLPAGTYNLTITGTGENAAATGDLDITDDIVINGNAASATIIDANAIDRVFEILGAGATFSNLTIRNGNVAGDGAGIALNATASAILSASTLSGNTTDAHGGGIATAGGTVVLTNVTLSGNTSDRGGGLDCHGPCTLTNVTVTANAAPDGSGVSQESAGTITFLNTIVANNIFAGALECDGNSSNFISNGYNLNSDNSCNFTNIGDLVNTDPLLGPFQNNGGPTSTHALLTGSPAIDAGTNTGCPATDQRGVARPVNVTCDIGAFESDVALPSLSIVKSTLTLEDPVSGTTDPKAIPSAIVRYLIEVTNTGSGTVDADTVFVADSLPAFMALRVIDFDGVNPGPVAFVDGSPSSGLSHTFTSLGSGTDDVEFSNDGGATWTYTPVDSGDGTDPAVTDIRINLKGIFAGSGGGGDPNFEVQFKVIVQ